MTIEPGYSLNRLLDALDYLVDDRVGLIHYAGETPREPGAMALYYCYAQACDTGAFCEASNFGNTGGAALKRDQALAKAVGEAVERYCSAMYDFTLFPLHSYEEAPFECVPPEDFALYTPEQLKGPDFLWAGFDRTTPVRWIEAYNPLTGKVIHVPACMVFVPYRYSVDQGEAPIVQPISTGLACHASLAEAARSGICEAIERDAFTIVWQAALSMPHLITETLSDRNFDLVERVERTGAAVTLLDLTMDHGVPTIMAVACSDREEAPALTLAASTRLDPEQAVLTALEELAHTRRYAQLLKGRMDRLVADPGYTKIKTEQDHLRFWADRDRLHLADFLFASDERRDFDDMENLSTHDPAGDALELCRRLDDVGEPVYLVDLTTPDVAGLGLAVVRAIVPGLNPLAMGYGSRSLGGRRLWEVPGKLGHPGRSQYQGDNPLPHPYP